MAVKCMVLWFNLFFFIGGLAMVIIGAVVQGFFSQYIQFFDSKYETPGIALIILGSIIMFISLLGCCGAKKENACLLTTFSVFLSLVIVAEIGACIAVAVLRAQVESVAQNRMETSMQHYGPIDSLVTETWDNLQQEYHCCGVHNYSEWLNSTFGAIPKSCCKDASCENQTVTDIYTNGCYESLKLSALNNMAAITVGAAILAIIQVVGMWMACGLSRGIRNSYEVL